MFLREFVVRKHERGLLLRNGDFVRFLAPAVYRFFDPGKRLAVERFDLSQPTFEHPLSDYLVRWQPEAVEDLFLRVETGADQIAVIYKNGHPWRVVGPEQRALFWKGVVHVKAEIVAVGTELEIAPRLARVIATDAGARQRFDGAVLPTRVPEAHVGLLYVDGALVRELPPGTHTFWNFGRRAHVEVVDLRLQELTVGNRDLPTKDKIGVSIDVHVLYRHTAPALTARAVKDPLAFLHDEARHALRAAVAARSLDSLLDDRDSADAELLERVRDRVEPIGVEVRALHIEDVAVEDDPIALRLKKLEAIERITDKVGNIAVFGGLDGVLGELVRLKL